MLYDEFENDSATVYYFQYFEQQLDNVKQIASEILQILPTKFDTSTSDPMFHGLYIDFVNHLKQLVSDADNLDTTIKTNTHMVLRDKVELYTSYFPRFQEARKFIEYIFQGMQMIFPKNGIFAMDVKVLCLIIDELSLVTIKKFYIYANKFAEKIKKIAEKYDFNATTYGAADMEPGTGRIIMVKEHRVLLDVTATKTPSETMYSFIINSNPKVHFNGNRDFLRGLLSLIPKNIKPVSEADFPKIQFHSNNLTAEQFEVALKSLDNL